MRLLRAAVALLCAVALVAPAVPAGAYSERSVGTPEQIAWVRRAAHRFLAGELAANGGEACAVLVAALRATAHGRTCEERWSIRLARLLHEPSARAHLLAQQRAVASARVVVRGDVASIELPAPLLHAPTRFLWTENCWMLAS